MIVHWSTAAENQLALLARDATHAAAIRARAETLAVAAAERGMMDVTLNAVTLGLDATDLECIAAQGASVLPFDVRQALSHLNMECVAAQMARIRAAPLAPVA